MKLRHEVSTQVPNWRYVRVTEMVKTRLGDIFMSCMNIFLCHCTAITIGIFWHPAIQKIYYP